MRDIPSSVVLERMSQSDFVAMPPQHIDTPISTSFPPSHYRDITDLRFIRVNREHRTFRQKKGVKNSMGDGAIFGHVNMEEDVM